MNTFFSSNPVAPASLDPTTGLATLVLEFGLDATPAIWVRQANAAAQELAGLLPFTLMGASLAQLPPPFNLPELREQLLQHRGHDGSLPFQLSHSDPTLPIVRLYTCQLLRVDQQRVVLTIQPIVQRSPGIDSLEQIMDTMPIGVALFKAIRDTEENIIDFQALLCNQRGAMLTRQKQQDILNKPISERYPDMHAFELYQEYLAVVTTGQPRHRLLYLSALDVWLDVSIVKYGDGLLVCFQDVTTGQKTASLLESVMSSSPASVRYYETIRDENGRIVDFMTSTGNELASYRHYRPLDSTVGERLLDLYPQLKTNGLFERYIAVVESGQSDQFETSVSLASREVWFDCRAVPHAGGFVLTILDITDRKEAQLAQQRQATVLQTVLDNSLTGTALLQSVEDATGQLVDFTLTKINATLAQTLRRNSRELEGKRLSELMPHQMTNGLFGRYVEVVRTGTAQRFEWANNARTVWYDVSVVPVSDGLIVTFMDITAIKLGQLAQQQQADLLQEVLNSSSNSIAVLEPLLPDTDGIVDFRITLANPATGRLFAPFIGREVRAEDFLAQTLLTLFPAVKDRALFTALHSVVRTGQSIHTTVDYLPLGLTYNYDIRPFREGVLMITTDITPLRVYQQQLEANNLALSRSNEYLQQFAYVASHDLQEPLRKIQAFSDMLLTQHGPALNATGQDLLLRQQQAANRMQTLVKDLLDYARLTTPSPPVQPVSLQMLLEDVLIDFETTIQATGARISAAQLPTIQGNATQLRQLLQNLLGNALKFTKPGMPPQVRVETVRKRVDQLPNLNLASSQEQWIELSVADEGIGFDASYQERIFDLFHRLHGRSQYGGTGIGLAIVKKVVENHRGFITAESQPGNGATFRVYLPIG